MKITIDNNEIVVGCFKLLDARMYILINNDEALIVDPCIDNKALSALDNSVKKIIVLLTHEHYDHISGVEYLKKRYDCNVVCTERCSEAIQNPKLNLAEFFDIFFVEKNEMDIIWEKDYSCHANEVFSGTKTFFWKNHKITLKEAPGHSRGGMIIFLDNNIVFTGDNLVNGNKVITHTVGGSKKIYKKITYPILKELSDDIWIFPGHGDVEKFFKLKKYIEI